MIMLPRADKKQSNEDPAPQAGHPADGNQHDNIDLSEHLLEYFRILIEWDRKAKDRGTRE
jgi:hypothetical protein